MVNLGFVHRNKSRKPAKTLDKPLSENIILLYIYYFIYTTLMNAGIVSPRVRKATRRKLIEQKLEAEHKLNNKLDEEIEVIVNREMALKDSHPRKEKLKYFGEVTQIDGSTHLYFCSQEMLKIIKLMMTQQSKKFFNSLKKNKNKKKSS